MKSDHRHELKTNELADWIAHFPEWARQNRTQLLVAGAVILVAVIVYFWSFYRKDVVSLRNQTHLTDLVAQVPQQMSNVARAAMQNQDDSLTLGPIARDLQEFAQKSSDNDMAALALIQRGTALRAELHYRLGEVSREELTKQIELARASYQQALDRKPSNPALTAAAQYGLGLCEEELGNFEKAGEIYGAVAQDPQYAGTTAQAAAAYRLQIMKDYRTEIVFKPAPPPAPAQPPVPSVRIQPGDANAPVVVPAPQDVNAGPATPGSAAKTDEAAAPVGPAPAPAAEPADSDTNAPKGR
jgi:tetratricopeptide (TPR) repeat protein